MASSNHEDIKNFMKQASAGGKAPAGKKMVYNKLTKKWQVISGHERPGDSVIEATHADMGGFGRG